MFANPWLLLAAAAVAVPIWVHLVDREDRRGQGFPSLMFVRRTRFKARQRRALRDRPLLLVRCLALLLLALAFAAPQWPVPAPVAAPDPAAPPLDTLVLIDRSYSMSAEPRWQAALARARDQLRARGGAARLGLASVDTVASLQVAPGRDDERFEAALERLRPSERGTRIGAGFDLANQVLRESEAPRRRLVLISDLQRSALAGIDRLVLDESVELVIEAVDAPVTANAAILGATLVGPPGGERRLRVQLANTGSQALPNLRAEAVVEDRAPVATSLALAPGERQTWDLPVTLASDRALSVRLRLGTDQIEADNRFDLVLPPMRPVRLGVRLTDADDSAVYIRRAAELARAPAIVVSELTPPADSARLRRDFDLVVADDLALEPPPWRRAIEAYLQQGGGLLLVPATGASLAAAAQRAPAFPAGLGPLRTYGVEGSALRAETGQGGLSDTALARALASTRVFAARELTAGTADRVLYQLDDGRPWLVERRLQAGRMLLLGAGLGRAWSDLVLQPGFAPWLGEAARQLAGRRPVALAHRAGRVVDLAAQASNLPGGTDWTSYLASGGQLVVQSPGGRRDRLKPGESLLRVAETGFYDVHRLDGALPALRLAVNAEPAESLLEAATATELTGRLHRRAAPQVPVARPAADEAPGPARALLLAVLLLLLLESGLAAGRAATRRPEVQT